MNNFGKMVVFVIFLVLVINIWSGSLPEPQIAFKPQSYAAPKIDDYILIDGKIVDTEWLNAAWTDYFVDIEGDSQPEPYYKTKVKMMWNDYYFYIAAKLVEPHVWGTLQKRDSVIFHDNDFEVFIDPDGDTHNYYELEINALGTVWDLLLLHPYREGGQTAIDSWDIQGLQSAVFVDGTINDPESRDTAWYVELGIPWNVLEECAGTTPPQPGDFWRVNFSRVQWETEVINNEYVKIPDTPEHNWVWSPQGVINMHYPEMWGYVYFFEKLPSSDGKVTGYNSEEQAKWILRQLHYKMYNFYQLHGYYTDKIEELDFDDVQGGNFNMPPKIEVTSSLYEATITREGSQKILHINNLGKTWSSEK
ncbi:MAG: carbohydrate-binding family 9-like protein [Candidatus Cloacimonetes bacterium]|nr:carbohydrate-binding family 9-like protein [Candidatus Cloacimonadota bacterium]